MDNWLYPLLRFAHYTLLLGLFGITAFRCIGLRETLAQQSKRKNNGALAVAAVVAPVLTITLMFLSIAAMMAQPVWQLEWATIEAMVVSTSIGWSFLFRLGLLSAAAFTLIGCPTVQWDFSLGFHPSQRVARPQRRKPPFDGQTIGLVAGIGVGIF